MELFKTKHRSAFAQAIRDRSDAGWIDTAATGVRRWHDRPRRRNPTAVSGVWLFLLSSLARSNGLLSLRLRQRKY